MTLFPDDLAAMGERHRPMEVGTLPDEEACKMCGGYWPCDSRRLLDEVEALRFRVKAVEEYAAEGWAWLDDALAALGVKTVFDIPKEVMTQTANEPST